MAGLTSARSQRVPRTQVVLLLAIGLLWALTSAVPVLGQVPAVASNVERVGGVEVPGAVSVTFSSRQPVAYVGSRTDGGMVVSLDITDPRRPVELDRIAVPTGVYMEDHTMGERADGTTFLLVREDHNGAPGLRVVDVTDPRDLRLRGAASVSPHTWTCVDAACSYAYGAAAGAINPYSPPFTFPVLDLHDLDAPTFTTVGSPGGFHDWNRDEAGVMWGVGREGIAAWDVSNPQKPRIIGSSDHNGAWDPLNELNDRLHLHGSLRPNAAAFDPGRGAAAASLERGNVLVVSEEGHAQDCTDSVQTWYVPQLRPSRVPVTDLASGGITPLDSWSMLETDPATRSTTVWCAVHWFDAHQDGFLVVPAYASGTRVLDVRDPEAIKEIGYHWEADDLSNQSYWVPERTPSGLTTGRATSLVYTVDVGQGPGPVHGVLGGIEILEVTLPD